MSVLKGTSKNVEAQIVTEGGENGTAKNGKGGSGHDAWRVGVTSHDLD
jgi:hypothetical protein